MSNFCFLSVVKLMFIHLYVQLILESVGVRGTEPYVTKNLCITFDSPKT